MTLAIAAEFPWGEWRAILDSAPGRFERSIILAADTRWSYDDGRAPLNTGRKLWLFGRQVGIVLAGDVWCGEDALGRLREEGQDAKFTGVRDVADMAESIFRETYASHLEYAKAGKRPPCQRLFFLAGIVDKDGYTAVIRFSSDADFRPIFLQGVHAIGVPSAIEAVRKDLIERVGRPRTNRNLTPDPVPWALEVAGALDEVISSGEEDSVGGKVQLAVGTKEGWSEPGVSILEQGGSLLENDDWRDATVRMEMLTRAADVGCVRLASCEDADLSIERIA